MAKALFYDVESPPQPDEVRRALAAQPRLLAQLGTGWESDGSGVLAEGLSTDDARELSQRLSGLGIASGDDNWLHLPPALTVRRMRIADDGGWVFIDGQGVEHRTKVASVVIAAAGALPHAAGLPSIARSVGPPTVPGALDRSAPPRSDVEPAGDAWVLELFTRDPVGRFRIHADGFHYGVLPDGPGPRARDNFIQLCQWVVGQLAVVCNVGLRELVSTGQPGGYPSWAAFEREVSAQLFRLYLGDLRRYPLPDVPTPSSAVDVVALLGGHTPVRTPRPIGKKRLLVALQLLVIAVLMAWFMRVVAKVIRGDGSGGSASASVQSSVEPPHAAA